MKKSMTRAMRSVFATAMAMTLAIPASMGMKETVVESADAEKILDKALVTYDFDEESDALEIEGEEYLLLEDSGEKDASGNAVMLPVVASGEYVKVKSEDLPEVTTDAAMGSVLRFKDSKKVAKYVKQKSDELDDTYKVGEILQTEEKIGGRVHLENPFKDKDLEGITISYWVKVPTVVSEEDPDSNYKGGKEIGANSTTIVFNNDSRYVVQKDDLMKKRACESYDKFQENAALESVELVEGVPETKVTRADFDLGKQEIVTDGMGNTYVLYTDYGKLVRYNPNYPVESVGGVTPTYGGGWYEEKDTSKSNTLDVTKADGKKIKILSFTNSQTPDVSQYPLFRYYYAAEDDLENGYSSKSRVIDGYIKGSMQITTDNDFHFREDSYRTESYTVIENGKEVVKNTPITGARATNPNRSENGEIFDFYGSNQFYFDGDEFVTQGKDEDEIWDNNAWNEDDEDYTGNEVVRPAITGADTWHYVTIVIENDWVQTYVDGVAASVDEGDYQYLKDSKNVLKHDFSGKDFNNAKGFNQGYGLRGIYGMQNNITDWPSNGTATSSPANAAGITMLKWLADANTELYLGGTSYTAEMVTQGYGTVDGVCMDDVSFFDFAMSSQQAVQLYKEAQEQKKSSSIDGSGDGTLGDVNGDGKINSDDAVDILKFFANLTDEINENAADVNVDGKINSDDAVEILKFFAGLESDYLKKE